MDAIELELFVLRAADLAAGGKRIEDARIELKREWAVGDDEPTAARQLAGLCNASASPWVVWLVGLGQDGSFGDVNAVDPSEWFSKIKRYFEGVAPSIILDLRIPFKEHVLIAILFDCSRPPYVWSNPEFGRGKGAIAREVPWRELTAVRAAKREDLLRILAPQRRVPQVELVQAGVYLTRQRSDDIWNWQGHVLVYVTATESGSAVIPVHKMKTTVANGSGKELLDVYTRIDTSPPFTPKNGNVILTDTEAIINGSGGFTLHLRGDLVRDTDPERPELIAVELTLGIQPSHFVGPLRCELPRRSHGDTGSQWYK